MKTKSTQVGDRRKAKNINYKLVFGPDIDDAIPFSENVDWIRQFVQTGCPESGYYLVVCTNQDCPEEIWWGEHNHYDKFFKCIYVEENE